MVKIRQNLVNVVCKRVFRVISNCTVVIIYIDGAYSFLEILTVKSNSVEYTQQVQYIELETKRKVCV